MASILDKDPYEQLAFEDVIEEMGLNDVFEVRKKIGRRRWSSKSKQRRVRENGDIVSLITFERWEFELYLQESKKRAERKAQPRVRKKTTSEPQVPVVPIEKQCVYTGCFAEHKVDMGYGLRFCVRHGENAKKVLVRKNTNSPARTAW